MPDTTEDDVPALLAQGMSQRAIAKQLKIPRTTIQRIIARQRGVPARPAPEVHAGIATIMPGEDMAPLERFTPDMRFDLVEIVEWWRQRKKIAQEYAGTPRETKRMTYHVEPRYIDLIAEYAKAEGVSITDIVNRAFRQFFEGR
jgi:IS30 family transposase